uniref:MMGP1 n=1 Tax=uncultured organism TaxID=155900 RepID=G9HQ31_9ZZZZ|nr:MMGP1 [uncultured organism]
MLWSASMRIFASAFSTRGLGTRMLMYCSLPSRCWRK